MDSQSPPAAVDENLQIATSLGCLDDTKGVLLSRHRKIPHVVGHPSPSQLEDLRRAWTSIPGFDLLLVSILGVVVTVGIIGFGAFKQMKV